MNPYIAELGRRLTENLPSFGDGDGDSILTMLYESYRDANRMDDERIKADFCELYQALNGMPLRYVHCAEAMTERVLWRAWKLVYDWKRNWRTNEHSAIGVIPMALCLLHHTRLKYGLLSEHESEIILHKAEKQFFDEQGLKKLPTVKSLQAECPQLLSEKKDMYAEYQQTKKDAFPPNRHGK